jgi:AcrR family transcriptional regulator
VDQVRTRTGGRSTRVRQRVLTAVKDALESGDTDGLTIDRLADKAGVHKATIYRRWLSSAGLVADLLTSLTPLRPELPDTGDLHRDLIAVARRVADTVKTPLARTTLQLAAASNDPDLTTAAANYWSQLLDHTADVIRRAQQRGDAITEIDPVDAIESLLGPIHMRTLVTRRPITPTDIERLAHRTARMLRP